MPGSQMRSDSSPCNGLSSELLHSVCQGRVQLTIFACPKPFTNPKIALIQRNAITSWTLLKERPEIILAGDEPGVAEICAELGVRQLNTIQRNSLGTPFLRSVFSEVQSAARGRLFCYVNADIILFDDFVDAVRRVASIGKMVMIGARTDVDVEASIDFADRSWETNLRSMLRVRGKLMSRSSDYFVFPQGFFDDLPPFLLGRCAYDNWMIWCARHSRAPVIDATESVLAVHQNHRDAISWLNMPDQSDNEVNRRLAGSWRASYLLADANFALTPGGLRSRKWEAVLTRCLITKQLIEATLRRFCSSCKYIALYAIESFRTTGGSRSGS